MKKAIILIALCSCVGFVSAQDTSLLQRKNFSEINMEDYKDVALSTDSSMVDFNKSNPQQVVIQPQHFGYLSYNDVLKAMPEYEQAMKGIAELKATYDQEMTRAEQEFSKKFAEYVDGQKSFPENIMLKRQKELQQLMEQSMQFKKEAQELLTNAEAELLAPVNEKLQNAIKAVGKQRNYAYVLNTDANAYPYISDSGEAENCTDAVLTQLGIK